MNILRAAACLLSIAFLAPLAVVRAAEHEAFTDPEHAGPDFAVQGEYLGKIGTEAKVGAQVVALGHDKFDAVLYTQGLPGAGWDGKTRVRLKGTTENGTAQFTGKNFKGTIKDGVFSGTAENEVPFEFKKTTRASPTIGAQAPPGATVLFDGKDTQAWKVGKIVEGNLLGVEALGERKFENFLLHVEFRTPFMPEARGQGRGNSGVYLLDQYEVQVLDSFGLEGLDNECGGIYKQAKPLVNMCFPPLSWQTYDIEFRAAKIAPDGKTKRQNAVITVRHNGVPIHYNLELKTPTPGGHQNDELPGPFFLQNHGNPVCFRNMWVLSRP